MFLRFLASTVAPKVEQFVALSVVLVGAAPDYGFTFLCGVTGLIVLAGTFVLSRVITSGVYGTGFEAHRKTMGAVAAIISGLAGQRRGDTPPSILHEPSFVISSLLRKAKEFTQATVRPPYDAEITANLLVPEIDDAGNPVHLVVTTQDDVYPDRGHQPIELDAPGAGYTFSTGKPAWIEHTEDVDYPRVRGRRYKSIASFPIIAGEHSPNGRVIAVLTIDSTQPYTFKRKVVDKLVPVVSPIAQLIGLALEIREVKEKEARHEQGNGGRDGAGDSQANGD